jgi:hypothetical protein
MASNENTKNAEAEIVVPELRVGKQVTTTKEKISAYFTIAAAAFGLISDGCKSPHTSYNLPVLKADIKMVKIRTTL